jgi:tripartite-type tricarboxylate transporter receptor subunit TctC
MRRIILKKPSVVELNLKFGFAAHAILSALVLTQSPVPAVAQQPYPSKPVRIISPYSPGGGNDTLCRIVARRLADGLGQQVVVENRPGGNAIVGTEITARAAPDGYTFVLVSSAHASNASLYRKLPYDTIRDFTPLTLVGLSPLVLAVHPSLPVKNIRELIALAKSRPGQLTYATSGHGSPGHLAGALFDVMAGTKLLHVPYKGIALGITDVIGGQVTIAFSSSTSIVPHVRAGRLRGLAITSARRSPSIPDLPTMAESGVPGYEASLWYGFFGPARIPTEIVRRLNSEIARVLALPDVREQMASQGVDARSSTPEDFGRLLAGDVERWAKVLQRVGITPE